MTQDVSSSDPPSVSPAPSSTDVARPAKARFPWLAVLMSGAIWAALVLPAVLAVVLIEVDRIDQAFADMDPAKFKEAFATYGSSFPSWTFWKYLMIASWVQFTAKTCAAPLATALTTGWLLALWLWFRNGDVPRYRLAAVVAGALNVVVLVKALQGHAWTIGQAGDGAVSPGAGIIVAIAYAPDLIGWPVVLFIGAILGLLPASLVRRLVAPRSAASRPSPTYVPIAAPLASPLPFGDPHDAIRQRTRCSRER